MKQKETVAVAVSGGADSLYTLLRLQEEGRKVFALHGIFREPANAGEAEAAAAMRERLADVCHSLGIALHAIDCAEAFTRLVIRPFVEKYAQGHTPNPCALCNASVKFGLLLDEAFARGATHLATGHYATLAQHVSPTEACPALYQAADPDKDQSYFLSLVPPERLAHALFPLAEDQKSAVLLRLAEQGITPPQPGESQELCFIPNDDYRAFLPSVAKKLGIALPGPGPMLLCDGRQVGAHKGLWQYTEGQRRGLGVGWKEPLHVLGKEKDGNVLRLGAKNEMRAAGCRCDRVNVLFAPEDWSGKLLVKTRYREAPQEAAVETSRDEEGSIALRIRFAKKETSVAPGQVAAVYLAAPEQNKKLPGRLRLVAGGIISEAE